MHIYTYCLLIMFMDIIFRNAVRGLLYRCFSLCCLCCTRISLRGVPSPQTSTPSPPKNHPSHHHHHKLALSNFNKSSSPETYTPHSTHTPFHHHPLSWSS